MFTLIRFIGALLFSMLLVSQQAIGEVDCKKLNKYASEMGVFIPGEDAGRDVIGKGRLQFYSAPNYSCKMKGIFVIEGQTVDAYTEYDGFTSVVYLPAGDKDPVLGWVKSNRLRPNGVGIVPEQK